MSDSKSGSKSDLNESNMPLLDDVEKTGETPEKEQIEMKEEGEEEKDDSKDKEKDKKKKEKKKKEPKEKKPKGPNCIDTLSAGLDLTARDGKAINTEINVRVLLFVIGRGQFLLSQGGMGHEFFSFNLN